MEEIFARLSEQQKPVRTAICINIAIVVVSVLCFAIIPFAPFIGIGVSALLWFFSTRKKIKQFSSAYKSELVLSALQKTFDDVVFNPDMGISRDVIAGTEMMMMGNTYRSNDYIRGSYKGVEFEQADVCIQDVHTDSDGHSHTTTYLRGRWMIFEFNKKFLCDLQVRDKGFGYSRKTGGLFSRKETKMKKVELESAEFNKAFQVNAVNEHEAFYICTPHFMEGLLELRNATKGRMMLAFADTKLHVAVNTNSDAFEAPIFRSISERDLELISADIAVVTRFADRMRLDNTLYKQDD